MKTELDNELMYNMEDVRKRVSEIRNKNLPCSIIEEIKPEEIPSEDEMGKMIGKIIGRIKSFENIYKDLTPAEELKLRQEQFFGNMIKIYESSDK